MVLKYPSNPLYGGAWKSFGHLFMFRAVEAVEISSLSFRLKNAPDGEFKFAGAFTRPRIKIYTIFEAEGADR